MQVAGDSGQFHGVSVGWRTARGKGGSGSAFSLCGGREMTHSRAKVGWAAPEGFAGLRAGPSAGPSLSLRWDRRLTAALGWAGARAQLGQKGPVTRPLRVAPLGPGWVRLSPVFSPSKERPLRAAAACPCTASRCCCLWPGLLLIGLSVLRGVGPDLRQPQGPTGRRTLFTEMPARSALAPGVRVARAGRAGVLHEHSPEPLPSGGHPSGRQP